MGADRSAAGTGAGGEVTDKKHLKRSFGLLAVLGLVLVVAGLVGLFYAAFATLTTMFLFGWLLLAGGLVGLVQAFQSRKSNHFWLAVVVAAINIAAGFVILRRPEASAEALTMFAALFFLIDGLSLLVLGMSARRILGLVREDEVPAAAGGAGAAA
ncbi:DUF308 domain-containing protein [Streptomyces sp. NPDC058290]|uniref:DUF308 domain-containing protein n=1 Tax=Streptomyces sp. NPDC058290 TaxID=3346426 RepID=UPI0036E341D2